MSSTAKKSLIVTAIMVIVLIADQYFKFWIKTNMYLGQEFSIIGDWFKIHFTENEGMAFGMTFGGDYGKLILSLFRIVAVFFIGYYLISLIKKGAHLGLLICIGLILTGALGNIIDSVFYGLIFSDSAYQVATVFPEGGGYSKVLYGKVVDMFYFPFYEGYLPDWVPIWGGEYTIIFRHIFNIADAAITCGVAAIIIWQKKFF